MPVSAANVMVGAADQKTTGAILNHDVGQKRPMNALDNLSGYKDSGYISPDGLTLTPEYNTTDITEWNGALVRRILESFNGTLSWAHLETDAESLRTWAGDVNVEETTEEVGKTIVAALGAHEHPHRTWAFRIKDGERRILIWVPDGQVTDAGEVTFTKSGAITWPVTLSTYPDEKGNCIYIILTDGKTTTAIGG
ncbi:hypothetical protein [Actinomyces procaprae]|uniref:phage tail tube protein n=1 Tax=Actinomyces procaprae TaxID=2560010 RepID=UPI00109DA541|nr:hypothetical protein [Actinomyces procaprae]